VSSDGPLVRRIPRCASGCGGLARRGFNVKRRAARCRSPKRSEGYGPSGGRGPTAFAPGPAGPPYLQRPCSNRRGADFGAWIPRRAVARSAARATADSLAGDSMSSGGPRGAVARSAARDTARSAAPGQPPSARGPLVRRIPRCASGCGGLARRGFNVKRRAARCRSPKRSEGYGPSGGPGSRGCAPGPARPPNPSRRFGLRRTRSPGIQCQAASREVP